jgi:hypothetical protein
MPAGGLISEIDRLTMLLKRREIHPRRDSFPAPQTEAGLTT